MYLRIGKLDRWSDAVEDYTISLKITPNNNFKALFNRFICYEKLGQVDLALKDCQAALTLQPDHLGCLTNRALLNEKTGMCIIQTNTHTVCMYVYVCMGGWMDVSVKYGSYPFIYVCVYRMYVCKHSSIYIHVCVQNSRVYYNLLVNAMGSGEMEASIADVNHAIELGGPVVSLLVIRARLKFKLNLLDDAIGIYHHHSTTCT